jgi:lysophospholipase L1-like esterase
VTVLRKLSPPPIRLRIACLSIVCLCASPLVAADVIVGIGDSVTKGDTARGVLSRLERDVISLEPTIVIIGVGDNDIIGNEAVAPPAPTAEAYFEVMDSMFSELKRNLPGASVFAMGMPTPVEKYTDMSWLKDFPGGEIVTDRTQAFFDAQFSMYNTVLRESAEQFGYHYVDIPSLWPSDVEESFEFYADGLHPNDAGYDMMTEILYSALRSTAVHLQTAVQFATWARVKQGR